MTNRTRFAPSPTGYLHIGGLRTALYCYLWAKKNNGDYILRIEDTDRTRYVEGAVENLIKSLSLCKVNHVEGPFLEEGKIIQKGEYGPYYQSERLELYHKYAKQLIDEGKAYYCFCTKERLDELREEQTSKGLTPKYDSKCSSLSKEEIKENLKNKVPYTIRMKLNDNEDVTFHDEIRGDITINTSDIDEQVLIKADGFPTYHFAVVIDDHFMKINMVIRGEEWLVSTPKHVLLYKYFGWEAPKFVHLPTVLNKNKKKLSKRDGSAAVEDFISKGYLPEAIVNYIALLGWSDPEGREILSLEELCESFSLDRINKSGCVFDIEKLNWVNAHYIKEKSSEELLELLRPYLNEKLNDEENLWLIECAKERMNVLSDIKDIEEEIISDFDINSLNEEEKEVMQMETNPVLFSKLIEKISEVETLTPEEVKRILKEIQKEEKIKGKALYMPARIAVTGVMHGADLTYIFSILGKEKVLKRLEAVK